MESLPVVPSRALLSRLALQSGASTAIRCVCQSLPPPPPLLTRERSTAAFVNTGTHTHTHTHSLTHSLTHTISITARSTAPHPRSRVPAAGHASGSHRPRTLCQRHAWKKSRLVRGSPFRSQSSLSQERCRRLLRESRSATRRDETRRDAQQTSKQALGAP